MNKQKQKVNEIINEIDIIMFGREYKATFEESLAEISSSSIVGIIFGSSVGLIADSSSNIPLYAVVGALTGGLFGVLNLKESRQKKYINYEYAYLCLSREKQVEVLKLSKRLLELYKQEITNRKNKKNINKYLQLKKENTMFDDFESNHPHFKLLSEEVINDIHTRGKLTPTEKFYEWKKLKYCPATSNEDYRCSKYDTCRDCTVAWASEKDEWDSFELVPFEWITPHNDIYKQMWWKDSKDIIKQKTKNI